MCPQPRSIKKCLPLWNAQILLLILLILFITFSSIINVLYNRLFIFSQKKFHIHLLLFLLLHVLQLQIRQFVLASSTVWLNMMNLTTLMIIMKSANTLCYRSSGSWHLQRGDCGLFLLIQRRLMITSGTVVYRFSIHLIMIIKSFITNFNQATY